MKKTSITDISGLVPEYTTFYYQVQDHDGPARFRYNDTFILNGMEHQIINEQCMNRMLDGGRNPHYHELKTRTTLIAKLEIHADDNTRQPT